MNYKLVMYIPFILLFSACSNHTGSPAGASTKTNDTITTMSVVSLVEKRQIEDLDIDNAMQQRLGWVNDIAGKYIKRSGNKLIMSAAKDTSVSWLWDRLLVTDTAAYVVLNIGHHMEEEDHSEQRFVTDGWFYVDTLTGSVYEYNVAEDNIIKL